MKEEDEVRSPARGCPTALTGLLVTLLLLSAGLNAWQKARLQELQTTLGDCMNRVAVAAPLVRGKREIGEAATAGTVYLPLYTQLSPKAVERLCAHRYETVSVDGVSSLDAPHADDVVIVPKASSDIVKPTDRNRTKWRNGRKKPYKVARPSEKCPLVTGLGAVQMFGERLYEMGSALRIGDAWFVTEYAMGYMLFEYNGTQGLSVPAHIYTLPMPFMGTDHAVARLANGVRMFYFHVASTSEIIAYDLEHDRSVQKSLPLAREPLYRHSGSQVDLQMDGDALFVLFREPNNTALSVWQLEPATLRERARHQVLVHLLHDVLNAFVQCRTLYVVRAGASVEPVFDLGINQYVSAARSVPWHGVEVPANVQADSVSRTLNGFDKGHIFSTPLLRT